MKFKLDNNPQMWIMKITPANPSDTELSFNKLFCEPNCLNVIGYSKYKGKIENYKKRFESMRIGDVVVVLQGYQKVVGCVVITSDAYDDGPEDDNSPDWFDHRRNAELLVKFEPPFNASTATNRDSIIEYSGDGAITICDEVWEKIETIYEKFNNDKVMQQQVEQLNDYKYILEKYFQVIFQGAPGTGKTRLAKELAYYIINNRPLSADENERKIQLIELSKSPQFEFIQFHPAYSYEDFIRGIVAKPSGSSINYEVTNKLLLRFADKAKKNLKEQYILIIDEINRANLPSVLGELIYALEYRDEVVNSVYIKENDEKIILPSNLYIIGTMNTADRSVGQIDYAIRRRFVFIPVDTDRNVIPTLKGQEYFDFVFSIFDQYTSPEFIKNDVILGHSYFLGDEQKVELNYKYQVLPILKEYLSDGVLVGEKAKEIISNEYQKWLSRPL